MLKHLTSWIHQQSRPLLLSGVAVVGVLGATYFTGGIGAKATELRVAYYCWFDLGWRALVRWFCDRALPSTCFLGFLWARKSLA
jgi:hypothetical protein